MKRIVAVLSLLLVVTLALSAAGQQEKKAAGTDRIVYLSNDYHDSPDVLPAWAQEFKRITGVDVVLQTVSSKDAGEGMMTRFMAGDLPDVVKFGEDNVANLVRQEYIIPLDGFIEKSPGMKKLKDKYPASFAAHSVNGVTYGVPTIAGQNRGIWVRSDILKKLGLSMPKTLDEFVTVLKKIRDGYPMPDGKPMAPYISKTYHDGYISILSNYWDVSLCPVVRRPGETKYREGFDSPQFRDYAMFIKMLWDERLIDKEHALPQKASATRSKLYAGQGAFLGMWVELYQELIDEVRKNFPDAELELVPPIRNPKGGVMGLSVTPGYRPFCITSAAKDPQLVWDKFIEPLFLTRDGLMLFYRGVPNLSYKVVDNVMLDNFEAAGHHMGLRSPLNPEIAIPYRLPPKNQRGLEIESLFDRWYSENARYAITEEPTKTVPAFDMIYDDMKDKKNQLFWKFILEEISYEKMLSDFEAYKKEINFSAILAELNSL